MTVAELIAELQKLPPDVPVVMVTNDGEWLLDADDVNLTKRHFSGERTFTYYPRANSVERAVVTLT